MDAVPDSQCARSGRGHTRSGRLLGDPEGETHVRLISFRAWTPDGPQVRIGAVGKDGKATDLALAYRLMLESQGLTPAAALRISGALLPGDMVAFIEGGERSRAAAEEALEWASQAGYEEGPGGFPLVVPLEEIELLPPIPRPPLLRDFMAFETHLRNIYPKLGREIPPEWYEIPVYYKGNPSSLAAHGEAIPLPPYARELDFEFELAAVIARPGRDIPRERAREYVFGYMIYNDFSAREIQSKEMAVGLGPAKGKDFVRGHAFGPWLVTADEIPDVYNLRMVARVNGQVWCEAHTGTIHWRFEDMIAHASWGEELKAGEIFGSGTVGWGSGAERGTFLKPGDVIELEVEGIGTLRNSIASSRP